ncbi:MAG: hypothetical protein PSN37_02095 [Alphaproteobacteria bacterium]|nr:hypothetical protein [Alphaproteobacteria bacterium]
MDKYSSQVEESYHAIEAAVMETSRGRWFLAEFSRRNRSADTDMLMEAISRLQTVIIDSQTEKSVERLNDDLNKILPLIAQARQEIVTIQESNRKEEQLVKSSGFFKKIDPVNGEERENKQASRYRHQDFAFSSLAVMPPELALNQTQEASERLDLIEKRLKTIIESMGQFRTQTERHKKNRESKPGSILPPVIVAPSEILKSSSSHRISQRPRPDDVAPEEKNKQQAVFRKEHESREHGHHSSVPIQKDQNLFYFNELRQNNQAYLQLFSDSSETPDRTPRTPDRISSTPVQRRNVPSLAKIEETKQKPLAAENMQRESRLSSEDEDVVPARKIGQECLSKIQYIALFS